MRRTVLAVGANLLAIAFAFFTLVACVGSSRHATPTETPDPQRPYHWPYEIPVSEGGPHPQIGGFFVASSQDIDVDVRVMQKQPFTHTITLHVLIVNRAVENLLLTRDSFRLTDNRGRDWTLMAIADAPDHLVQYADEWRSALTRDNVIALRASQAELDFRRSLLDTLEWPRTDMNLFPQEDEAGIEVIYVPTHSWAYEVLFFNHPVDFIGDTFHELWITPTGANPAMFVRVKVWGHDNERRRSLH